MMADGEVSYASVVFKANKQPRQEAHKEEETVYDEVKVANQTAGQNPDANGFFPDNKADSRRRRYQQLACGLGALCVVLLLGIIAIVIYISTLHNVSDVNQLNQLKDNQTALMIANLTKINNKLSSDYENLRRNTDNLTQAYAVSERNITSLTAANWNLTMKIKELNAQKQELEMDKNNLAELIQNWNKLNTSRAQWSIDAYCPIKDGKRQCNSCQKGWLISGSNCYGINNAKQNDTKTWEEAQENCNEKSSDLAVVATAAEKTYVEGQSWATDNLKQYWIGLRAVNGTWKWLDGSVLTDDSWMSGKSAVDGFCAVSTQNDGWNSVNCAQKNRWICQMKALSV